MTKEDHAKIASNCLGVTLLALIVYDVGRYVLLLLLAGYVK